MPLSLRKLHPLFAAEITGIDLRQVHDQATLDEIRAGLDEHAVLVIRDQPFSDEEQVAFTERFDGSLFTGLEYEGGAQAAPGKEGPKALEQRSMLGLEKVSNLNERSEIVTADDRRRIAKLGNRIWHTDGSQYDPSVRYTMLSGRVIPPVRADTEFADTRAAYDALDTQTKKSLDGLRAFHSVVYSRNLLGFTFSREEEEKLKGAVHPVVRVIPRTGRHSLYLGAHASHIVDVLVPEGRLMLRDLTEHATQDRFVYRHEWRQHDLLIWDNRATMHRARPFDDARHQRDMRRTRTRDTLLPLAVGAS